MASPPRVEVRSYAASDRDFVVQLSHSAFAEYAHFPVGQIASSLGDPGISALVATASLPVGFAIVRHGKGSAYLEAIAVLETHRGRGIGRALLHAAERAARRRGAEVLELATSQANVSAIELFLNGGYSIRARKTRYYERGQDAVVLRKRLRTD